jgi:hypothetical protein
MLDRGSSGWKPGKFSAEPKNMITTLLAIYSSIVATAAIFFQARQWLMDRGRLSVEANMSIESRAEFGHRTKTVLSVRAVNKWHRPVRVKKLAALLVRENNIGGMVPSSAECLLHGADGDRLIELGADGGEHIWRTHIPQTARFLAKRRGVDLFGTAYVLLTSEEQKFVEFVLISDEIRRQHG